MKRKDVFEAFDAHEKEKIYGFLKILLDANEPEALLASLRRLAEQKAFGVTLGRIDAESAERWQRMADTIKEVQENWSFRTITRRLA